MDTRCGAWRRVGFLEVTFPSAGVTWTRRTPSPAAAPRSEQRADAADEDEGHAASSTGEVLGRHPAEQVAQMPPGRDDGDASGGAEPPVEEQEHHPPPS